MAYWFCDWQTPDDMNVYSEHCTQNFFSNNKTQYKQANLTTIPQSTMFERGKFKRSDFCVKRCYIVQLLSDGQTRTYWIHPLLSRQACDCQWLFLVVVEVTLGSPALLVLLQPLHEPHAESQVWEQGEASMPSSLSSFCRLSPFKWITSCLVDQWDSCLCKCCPNNSCLCKWVYVGNYCLDN